jgi:uncharacterized GH25 family protein
VLRDLRIRYQDGRPAAGSQVVLSGQRGQRFSSETDQNGRLEFDWDGDWIEQVEVDGEIIKRDWSLSTLLGSKRELELLLEGKGGAGAGIERTLTLRYPDRRPVAKKAIAIIGGGQEIREMTDSDGRLRFSWSQDYIERVEIEQLPVKRDWSISGVFGPQRDLTLEVPYPDSLRDRDRDALKRADRGYTQAGVRGRLYYGDGTQVREHFKVAVSLQHSSGPFDSEQPGCYCQEDGSFYIATPDFAKNEQIRRMWVNGDEIPSSRWIYTPSSRSYVILIPSGFRRGGGDKGGVVAGQVVDGHGQPAINCRVTGEVTSSSFFSLQRPQSETFTDEQGRFVLMFEGGIELKRILLDGNEPLGIYLGSGKGAQQIKAEQIKAGSFGLTLVRAEKTLGIF